MIEYQFFFFSVVSLIFSSVIIYTREYIQGDKTFTRFIYLVVLFVISIFLLTFRPNILRLLLGWDGLGLISYVLVIYYQNNKSSLAGIITFLSNRIGDRAILLSISVIRLRGSFIFINIYACNDFILIFIIIAAITKRAQIPFSAWLPAAIAAPTPVSALVHSSTLVTAGIYLIIRFNYILSASHKNYIFIIGSLTAVIAGFSANFEFDIKKIIALSTLRQLGFIIRIIGLKMYKLSFFHLLSHAIFKALLFICAGIIIHAAKGSQDLRHMCSLTVKIPYTSCIIIVANFALCGLPFLAGFYSKDLIIEYAIFTSTSWIGLFMYILATMCTVSYTFRMFIILYFNSSSQAKTSYIYDSEYNMSKSIVILSAGAIIGGCVLDILIIKTPLIIRYPDSIKISIWFLTSIGIFIGYYISKNNAIMEFNIHNHVFMLNMWYINSICVYIGKTVINRSNYVIYLDKSWIEGIDMYKFIYKNLYIHNTLNIYLSSLQVTAGMCVAYMIIKLISA